MEFEQKVEEKKMSMSKNIARLAVTAGLTAALSFGGIMAPVSMAFAADGATTSDNSITISQADKNGTTKFKAYQIFKAKVVDQNGSKVASDIKWADDGTGKAVIGVLKQVADSGIKDSSTAEDVANYLDKNVEDTTNETRVNNSDLLYKIAEAVAKNSTQTGNSFEAGTAFTAPSNGYYLFVTDALDAAKPNTGTSPIFALVGGKSVTVTEKTSIPTVTKKVKDDKPNSNWADKADSQMGQNVNYQLTGTVANNVASFSAYKYEFHDELSAGLTVDEGSIKVYAGTDRDTAKEIAAGNKYTADVTTNKTTGKSTLTVKFTDLKTAVADLSAQTRIYVEYAAQLDPKKDVNVVVGGNGNENTVKLVYSNNPMVEGTGTSVPDTVRDYTYALKLVKQDHESKDKLQNVGFTIQATVPDDNADGSASKGKYVQEHGNLGETPHEFFTDKNGEIYIKGLDAGTYTVLEQTALGNYNSLKDFTFTISTQASSADSLHKTEEEAQTVTVTRTAETSDLVILNDATQTDGTVTLTVENKKGSGLPLTGLNGVTFTWIAGGAVLCIGVAHLIRSRKQTEESEQE